MTRANAGYRGLVSLLGLLLLSGCAQPIQTAPMGPSGVLTILEASADLETQLAAGDIYLSGSPPRTSLGITRHRGETAIRMAAAGRPYAIARNVDSLLLNSPFVEWRWAAQRFEQPRLPVFVVVGLSYPHASANPDDLADDILDISLPESDLLLVGYWSRPPTTGHALSYHDADQRVGFVSIRQGDADFGLWHTDGMDVLDATRQLWPGAIVADLHVRFVALAAAPSETPDAALISYLSLHR